MKKFVILLALVLSGATILSPVTSAQTRGRNNTSSTTSRPSQSHAGHGTQRPGGNNHGNNGNHNGGQRPGGNNHGNHGNHNGGQRPGGGNNHGNNGNHNGHRPSYPAVPPTTSHRPAAGPRPGYHNPPRPGYIPPRPHTPPSYVYYRPTPPPSWRPVGPVPSFGTILGITLGSILANSVNTLVNSGYNVVGYNNNQVYLSNVNLYNLMWPNVTMYYNNGYLNGSLFSYASAAYDLSRYNYVYNQLMNQYGMPVTTQTLNNGGTAVTWWGYNNSYITLSYYPEYLPGAGMRYFTTISLGN